MKGFKFTDFAVSILVQNLYVSFEILTGVTMKITFL
jgi:hypothetical protein